MHSQIHKIECQALGKLEDIADISEVDKDLIRMSISYISRIMVNKTNETKKKISSLNFFCTRTDVEGLISHRKTMSEDMLNKSRKAADSLMKLFAVPYVSVDQIVDFMCQVNSNCHGLSAINQTQYGLGLYPLGAIFNHSCHPNCLYVNEGKLLVFRCVRPVKKGEELTVNYVSLYQSRNQRRKDLLQSKNFLCNCSRCSLQPTTEAEKLVCTNDQYIQGIICTSTQRCAGIYRPTTLSCSLLPEERVDVDFTHGEMWVCSECGDKQQWYPTLQEIEKKAGIAKEAALEIYASDVSLASKREILEKYMTTYSKNILHHTHWFFHDIYLCLINLCARLHDARARLDYARACVACVEAVFPANFLVNANLYKVLSFSVDSVLEGRQGPPPPAKILERYLQEKKGALQHCLDIYRVCCGEQHSYTLEARQLLASLSLIVKPMAPR